MISARESDDLIFLMLCPSMEDYDNLSPTSRQDFLEFIHSSLNFISPSLALKPTLASRISPIAQRPIMCHYVPVIGQLSFIPPWMANTKSIFLNPL
jgi:hypothetical protein